MRLITSIFLLASAVLLCGAIPAPHDGIARIKLYHERLQNAIFGDSLSVVHHVGIRPAFRSKRQAENRYRYDVDSTDDEEDSLSCLARCANQLRGGRHSFNSNGFEFLSPSEAQNRFDGLCGTARTSLQCVDQCPESSTKASMKELFDLMRYICVDRFEDFRTNLPCIRNSTKTLVSQCTSRCREHEREANQLLSLARNPNSAVLYSQDEIKAMLSGACSQTSCLLNCVQPKLRQTCGETAADLQAGVVRHAFKAIRQYGASVGQSDVLPASCTALAEYTPSDANEAEPNAPEIPDDDTEENLSFF